MNIEGLEKSAASYYVGVDSEFISLLSAPWKGELSGRAVIFGRL